MTFILSHLRTSPSSLIGSVHLSIYECKLYVKCVDTDQTPSSRRLSCVYIFIYPFWGMPDIIGLQNQYAGIMSKEVL